MVKWLVRCNQLQLQIIKSLYVYNSKEHTVALKSIRTKTFES
jgi:hypothetical protein